MEFLSNSFDWLREPDNRGAVQVLVAVAALAVAWATGLLKGLAGLLRPTAKERPPDPDLRQSARSGGVNVGGNARDVTTHARRDDDPPS